MRSQETYALMKSGKEIRVAIETDGDRVGGLLNEQHPLPVVKGEPAFDYRQHMRHLSVQLDSAIGDAVVAEDEHAAQLVLVSRVQSDRDEAFKTSFGKLASARQGFESLYKRGGFELALASGDTPRTPERLVEQLGQTVKLLNQPVVEPRKLNVKGFCVNFGEVATDLESEKVELSAKIDLLDMERKTAEGTLVAKHKAISKARRTIVWVGRTTEGLFHLAGEDDLADRIRSSTRRPARPSEQAATESPAEETGSQDETAPEPQVTPASPES